MFNVDRFGTAGGMNVQDDGCVRAANDAVLASGQGVDVNLFWEA